MDGDKNKDLKEIVAGHVDENIVDDEKLDKDGKPVVKDDKQDDDDDDVVDDEDKEEDDDITEEDIKENKTLLKLLRSPATRKDALLALLEMEGVEAPTSKKEEKQVARTIKNVLKERLGDKYDLIPGADELAEALEEIAASILSQSKEGQKDLVLQNITEKVERAERFMAKKYDDFAKIKPYMVEVNKVYPWTSASGQSIADHMEESYTLAKARYMKSKAPKGGNNERQERINRNSDRQTPRGVSGHPQGDKPEKPKDLKSIVQASYKQLSKTRS